LTFGARLSRDRAEKGSCSNNASAGKGDCVGNALGSLAPDQTASRHLAGSAASVVSRREQRRRQASIWRQCKRGGDRYPQAPSSVGLKPNDFGPEHCRPLHDGPAMRELECRGCHKHALGRQSLGPLRPVSLHDGLLRRRARGQRRLARLGLSSGGITASERVTHSAIGQPIGQQLLKAG
jgi:hypothetical protein